MLSKYKVIIWDFDGVLMRSNEIRTEGFRSVLKKYPTYLVEELITFHIKNGGLSRYVKFRYFFNNILKQSYEEKDIIQLASEFSLVVKKKLMDESLLINESIDFIRLNQSHRHYIASGSDEQELNEICTSVSISNYFIEIKGSPIDKSTNVANILNCEGLDKTDFCLIGDSINDLEAAANNGIDFYGFNNESLLTLGKGYLIKL